MREWKPGDVAMVVNYVGEEKVVRYVDYGQWSFSDGSTMPVEGTSARPLVVLDPESPEDVARLLENYYNAVNGERNRFRHDDDLVRSMQAALRELANPTVKLEEPTKLGARVTDADGEMWVRHARGEWSCLNSRPGTDVRDWAELTAQYGPIEVEQP